MTARRDNTPEQIAARTRRQVYYCDWGYIDNVELRIGYRTHQLQHYRHIQGSLFHGDTTTLH